MDMAISASSRMRECGTRSAEAATDGVIPISLPICFCRDQFFEMNQVRGIVAGVAGVTVFAARVADRLAEGLERQIGERVGFDVLADLFDGVISGDQLALAGGVDAVKAG